MGKIKNVFDPPKPDPVTPPPPPPLPEDPEIAAARRRERRARLRRQGLRSTILTSGLGDSAPSPAVRKRLLGQ